VRGRRLQAIVAVLLLAGALSSCTIKISRQPSLPPSAGPAINTPTHSPSPTAFPTVRPTASNTPVPTATGMPSRTPQPTPTPMPTASQTASPTPVVYVVQPGDTLNRIAYRFGTTPQAIAQANGIAPTSTLRIDQQLIIPSSSVTPVSLPARQVSLTLTASPFPSTQPATSTVMATSTLPSAATRTPSPTYPPQPTPAGTVSVKNVEITISAYQYESAFVPSEPTDPIYPYPHLDFDRVGPPKDRTFQAIRLENPYTAITIVPALGGRIYRWVDKTTGRDLLYRNPVLKPTHWGYRGWWLAAGGMEWAFPVDEHGLNEYRPWHVQATSTGNQATVLVSDTEGHTGMSISVAISLDSTHSYFTIQPRIYNPTSRAQPYQFWINAMTALANNRNEPSLRFVLPTDQVSIHSTNDPNLPKPKTRIPWPVYKGRDLSLYGNWRGYLGLFESPQAQQGFMGGYDPNVDEGIVRVFPPSIARGVKIFGPGTLNSNLWTDDDSNYVELWGGVTPTFWDYSTLNPDEVLTWKERWYAVSGLGGFRFANEQVAVNAERHGGDVQVSIAATGYFAGQVVLRQGERILARQPLTIMPGHPHRAKWQILVSGDVPLSLQIQNRAGRPIGDIPLPSTP